MPTNRLEVQLALEDIERGISRLRATKTEMRELEGAADKAERSVDGLGDEFDQSGRKAERFGRSAGKAGRETDALARAAQSGISRLAALGAAATGAAASLAFIGTIRVGAGFEEQMSAVLAITQATQDQFESLAESARHLGATTVFSAREAAEGMEFLARAGFNAEQIIGALPGTLNLAASGALGLGEAADIASNVLTGFGLAAEQAGRVSDVLAKAAASSNTNVQQLGEGLKFVAPIAAGLGVSLEETTAAIGKLSDAGLQASVAGTGLRRILSELASPTDKLQALLGGLSLEADGFSAVMAQLAQQSISTGDALEIFGDRGGPAFTVLLEAFRNVDEQGVSSLERLSVALQQASGFAEKTAETMTDNFNGAVKQAKSALDELFITAAVDGGALEGLTAVVESLADALRSDEAKNFAREFGEAIEAASYATLGLIDLMDDLAERLGVIIRLLNTIQDFTPLGRVDDLAGGAINILEERGRNANAARRTDAAAVDVPTDIASIITQIGSANAAAAEFEARMAQIGEGSALGGLLRGFDNFNKHLVAANDNIAEVGAKLETIKPPEVGAIQQALLDQVAVAERLAEAAKGGQIEFDIVLNDVELDALAQQAVDKAKEAGEELSFATARMLVGQIDGLEKAAQAMLDATDALDASASKRLQGIADGLEGRINAFTAGVQDVDLRAVGPNAKPLLDALSRQFDDLLLEVGQNLFIGLDEDQIAALKQALDEAGIVLANKFKEAAETGGLGLAARIREALEAGVPPVVVTANLTADFASIGGQFFDGLDRALETFRRGAEKTFESITRLISDISGSVSRGLGDLGDLIGGSLGGALGKAGAVTGAVGQVAGLISSAVGFLKDLFSKPSDNTAQIVFRSDSGQVLGRDQDGSGAAANARVRDSLVDSILEATTTVAELIGARVVGGAKNFLDLAVKSDRKTGDSFIELGRNQGPKQRFDATSDGLTDAVNRALELMVDSLKGGENALLRYAKAAIDGGDAADDVIAGLRALSDVFASFTESDGALRAYANAAIDAGRSAQEIVQGLNALKAVTDLAQEPLSNVAQGIKAIDDAVNPVIDDLKSLGQSIAGVSQAAQEAGRALGKSFVDGIQEDIDRLSNETLADFRALLKQQAQDLADANALLNRGFITPDEFRLVGQRNALQQASFFENLDEDALNDLGDYLGLIRENGGEAAVVLLQFNQELDATRDKLTSGLSSMREEADRFFAAAQQNFNLSDDIQRRLSNETGTVQLATFRADLLGLLEQARGGDVTAAERAPDVARQFIELAERQFQGAAGLGEARDFVTNILDQFGEVATGFGNERVDAISLAEQQVSILDQIKGALESPDPAVDVLQSILANGELQSATLRDLLDQYVQLSINSPAQSYTPGQVQQAAQQIVIPSDLRITNTVNTDAPGTVLAINTAAKQANDNASANQERLEEMKRSIDEMQLAITKLDTTLRAR